MTGLHRLYKILTLILALVTAYLIGASNNASLHRIEQLSAENERLRLFNARRARRLKHFPPAVVDKEAVEVASHILGTPASVIAAVWRAENGPPDIETGNKGKTDFFAQHFPIRYWASLEAARTMNRLAWEWFVETPEGRHALRSMLKRTARIYTGMNAYSQRNWIKNFLIFERQEREDENIKRNH